MTAAANLGLGNLARAARLISYAGLILAFLVAGGAFSLQLSGLDPRLPVGADSASIRSEIALALAFAALLLTGARRWRRLARLWRASGFILALPALAVLSSLWAPEPMVAFRRAAAFGATVLSGFALAARFPGRSALSFLARAAAAGTVLSLVYVAAAPGFGVHQVADGVQSTHAGDWRGLFVHRTALGQLAALTLAMAVFGGRAALGPPAVRAGVAGAAALGLVGAHSGGGWISAAMLLATPWIVRGLRLAGRRLVGAALVAAGLTVMLVMAPVLIGLILRLLHKDATLTGRTGMWEPMLRAAAAHPWLGYGYSTGFRDTVAALVMAQSRMGYVPNAQDGYLDALLNLGLVGLGLALAGLGLAFKRALRLANGSPEDGLSVLPLLIVVFIAEMNLGEAALISASDIFVMIYVTALVASGEAAPPR